jgi:hypothetical protein
LLHAIRTTFRRKVGLRWLGQTQEPLGVSRALRREVRLIFRETLRFVRAAGFVDARTLLERCVGRLRLDRLDAARRDGLRYLQSFDGLHATSAQRFGCRLQTFRNGQPFGRRRLCTACQLRGEVRSMHPLD